MDMHLTSAKKESVLKSMILRLEEIKKEKLWSVDRVGRDFAELLVKEPPAPVMMPMNDYYEEDDYYGEAYQDNSSVDQVAAIGGSAFSSIRPGATAEAVATG